MRRLLTVATLLLVCLAVGCKRKAAVTVRPPDSAWLGKPQIVGCPADGQQGAETAPAHPEAPKLQLAATLAARLAYYQGAYGLGVLAPRGWHCLNLAGSNGDFVLVTPQLITGEHFFSTDFKGLDGPAVQLSGADAGTSGRFEVAEVIRRVFPAHEAFADHVIAEGLMSMSQSKTPRGPYPADKLTYLSTEWLEYITAAHAEGLGTQSRLNANGQPIRGFVMLVGDPEEYDLVHLSLRLAPADSDLASVISQQAESEAKDIDKDGSSPK